MDSETIYFQDFSEPNIKIAKIISLYSQTV